MYTNLSVKQILTIVVVPRPCNCTENPTSMIWSLFCIPIWNLVFYCYVTLKLCLHQKEPLLIHMYTLMKAVKLVAILVLGGCIKHSLAHVFQCQEWLQVAQTLPDHSVILCQDGKE